MRGVISTGLLARNMSLLAKRDTNALTGKKPSRGYADNTATDDHDVRRIGDFFRWT